MNLSGEQQTKLYNTDQRSKGRRFLDWLSGFNSSNSRWKSDANTPDEIKRAEERRKEHDAMQVRMNEASMMALDGTSISCLFAIQIRF